MSEQRRGCAGLLALFATIVFSAICAAPLESGPAVAAESDPAGQPAAGSTSRPGHTTPPLPSVAPTSTPAAEAPDQPPYTIGFSFRPDVVTYFVIENEFRDSGGVPGWLSYTTTVRDKRTIIRRTTSAPAPAEDAASPARPIGLSWECDRYEASERSSGSSAKYDSLRHSYPPPSLRQLGKIPGSRISFSIDPRSGEASEIKITPAPVEGPASREKLSRTAKRCSLTSQAFRETLFDLGPFYFPVNPQRVGDQWTKTHTRAHATFGTVVTNLTCTLRSVDDRQGRKIATIDLFGEIQLKAKTPPSSRPATTKPKRRRPVKNKKRNFKIDKAVCAGTVEFDLTRGELVTLTLRRELECTAKLESPKSNPMMPTGIRAGTSHLLRVAVSRTPPPKPVIVGGPKPPPLPPEKAKKTKPLAKRPPAATQRARPRPAAGRKATTQPSRRLPAAGRKATTRPRPSRPRSARRGTTRPSRPKGAPAAKSKPKDRNGKSGLKRRQRTPQSSPEDVHRKARARLPRRPPRTTSMPTGSTGSLPSKQPTSQTATPTSAPAGAD